MSVQQNNEKLSEKPEQQKQFVLDTLQRCLENSTNLRLTAENTQILGQTKLFKKLCDEVGELNSIKSFDLNNQKKAIQEKIKYCVVNEIGLRLSSLELKLLCETDAGHALGLNNLVKPKTQLEYLKEAVEKIQKAISFSYGIRLSMPELSFLMQTKTIQDFLKSRKVNEDSLSSEKVNTISDGSKTTKMKTKSEIVDFPREKVKKVSIAQPKTSEDEFSSKNESNSPSKALHNESDHPKQTETNPPQETPIESLKPHKETIEPTKTLEKTEQVEKEKEQAVVKVKPAKTPPKREYCIAREVPADQSIGLSDLEFLVDEALSNSKRWTRDSADIAKIYTDFNLAKDVASQNFQYDKSVRVVPKKIAIRKIEEQIEAARIEKITKPPVGVGEGLGKLNLM